MTATQSDRAPIAGAELKKQISALGNELATVLTAIIRATPGEPKGPVDLGRALGLDKVLASRVMKAARQRNALAVVHCIPGPDPLRRLLRAASDRGVAKSVIADAHETVDRFESLIRREAGDRSNLDAIISFWLPEARQAFETRRKQAAFKAMSQIKGAYSELNLAAVLLHPASDARHVDLLWVIGSLGLQRLVPSAAVKFTSRRIAHDDRPRTPTTLTGRPVEGIEGLQLDEFCSDPPMPLQVHQVGDVVHYTLADNGFGPGSASDMVFAEMNLSEMERHIAPGSGRQAYVFAEVNTPTRALLFDVLVHEDIYPDADPTLMIYDTVLDGVASVNDRARDIDRFDLGETIEHLGKGPSRLHLSHLPRYSELIARVFDATRWDAARFRAYRCRIEFPIYGSQVVMAFDPPTDPAA